MSNLIKEFKEFAMRGNVIDMAVGVVIGAAFGKIVSSLVDDIIMPLVGVATGGINFTDYKWVVQKAVTDAQGAVVTPEVTMNWGAWVQTVVDFMIVAFCIFIMIKFMNNLRKKKPVEEEAPAPALPEPTAEEKLLTEIRDLLRQERDSAKKH
ncbi:MAG: large conductance mechanosensitive channel protein MscL [Candidatus Amulumruptor caecigallinarius]|uniref:Large-conductance mechanosensitive channel n=1 Tax=Candidatus Amulumruptor caecigallinarius TaxID=2109911 RepID=A0A4Q0U8Y1_9BACT|nr:MAG: large conductance mechanosensitive channel protein MscL [Candidatus Amulumruptor caecigallinarius]HJE38500.1 large-conductance mechanosensitive channel protein MscL [Candidatus Amulumruptor caecigallinarius]